MVRVYYLTSTKVYLLSTILLVGITIILYHNAILARLLIWIESSSQIFLYFGLMTIWPTLQNVNYDFYESDIFHHHHQYPKINHTQSIPNYYYKPRPIEELYFSNGYWKLKSTNQILRFRGINLPSKTPFYKSSLEEPSPPFSSSPYYSTISFIHKPFPIQEAHIHFKRLSSYGINLIRLIVTWEAVMHQGPGVIDTMYLNYISKIVDIASEYGLYVIVDPHQDVWSRWSGGDGAPLWTLHKVGFRTSGGSGSRSTSSCIDLWKEIGCAVYFPVDYHESNSYFSESSSNSKSCHKGDESHSNESNRTITSTKEESPPSMHWITNYGKLITATMFTLFFAGDTFAPGVYIQDIEWNTYHKKSERKLLTAQSYLQKYYLQFLDAVAFTMKDKANVLGFNTMNEPSNGLVGIKNLNQQSTPGVLGYPLSIFQQMKLGSGESLHVPYYKKPFLFDSMQTLNPSHEIVWQSLEKDIWKKMGIYNVDSKTGERILLKPNYFQWDGDFGYDFMLPFYQKVHDVVRKHSNRFVIYAEPHFNPKNPIIHNAPNGLDVNTFAWSPHWYDAFSLILKTYIPWFAINTDKESLIFGQRSIERYFTQVMQRLKKSGLNNMHVIIGEIGIPFDMGRYEEMKDKRWNEATMALERSLKAVERNDLDYILWNYDASNTYLTGDNWNGEDLSIRSENENRGLVSVIRPFLHKYDSNMGFIRQRFDPSRAEKRYELVLECLNEKTTTSGEIVAPVEIYLPAFHYANVERIKISISEGSISHDLSMQKLVWSQLECSSKSKELSLQVSYDYNI